MKKQLLLASLAMASLAPMAYAQNPDDATHSTNLTLEWYGVPEGVCLNAGQGASRSGIGVNGKFYLTVNNKGVAVYTKDGMTRMIDNPNTWVSINCDDAGHVYFRNDKGGWAGPEGAGWYLPENAQFSVIDSKTDMVVKTDVSMIGGVKCRFDALPHVMGDMVNGFIEIPVTANATGNIGYDFMYDKLTQTDFTPTFDIATSLRAGKFPKIDDLNNAGVVQTLGQAQLYAPDQYGSATKMAVLSNNQVLITASSLGWGNNVALYTFDEDSETFKFSGKWFNTPNHASIGGFCMFNYDGKDYIVYPTGMTAEGYPSGDGFFVMEEELLDSPQNLTQAEDADDWSAQLHKAVATKYATDGISSGNNWRGINVEPIDGQDGKFRIYFYNPGKSMQVWILDLTGSAGINDIVADKSAAKIYGGVGVVVVDGAEKAQVYTPAGVLVGEGAGSISVAPGVYVVKAGENTAKVIVR